MQYFRIFYRQIVISAGHNVLYHINGKFDTIFRAIIHDISRSNNDKNIWFENFNYKSAPLSAPAYITLKTKHYFLGW